MESPLVFDEKCFPMILIYSGMFGSRSSSVGVLNGR